MRSGLHVRGNASDEDQDPVFDETITLLSVMDYGQSLLAFDVCAHIAVLLTTQWSAWCTLLAQ